MSRTRCLSSMSIILDRSTATSTPSSPHLASVTGCPVGFRRIWVHLRVLFLSVANILDFDNHFLVFLFAYAVLDLEDHIYYTCAHLTPPNNVMGETHFFSFFLYHWQCFSFGSNIFGRIEKGVYYGCKINSAISNKLSIPHFLPSWHLNELTVDTPTAWVEHPLTTPATRDKAEGSHEIVIVFKVGRSARSLVSYYWPTILNTLNIRHKLRFRSC